MVLNNIGSGLLLSDLEISRIFILAEDITKGEIESFLNENNVKMLDCWILKSKIYNSVSARVRIPLDMKDNILSADFWPKGIKDRSWVMKPRARSPMYEDIDE